MMHILEYITDDGASPFARWFGRLNAPAALKVRRAVAELEMGNWSNTKTVGGSVRERVIDFGPGYRVYFGRDGEELVILLGGGTKKRQQKDIDAAKELWSHFKKGKATRQVAMALTREFKESILKRAQEDSAFREGLLTEALECFLAGDLATGKLLLRDYINATIGFQTLSKLMRKKDSSLQRMLGPTGNPAADNLFTITRLLQNREGVELKVVSQRTRKRTKVHAA